MRFIFILVLLPCGMIAQKTELRSRISAEALRVEPKVIEWRRDFHAHPELGNQEKRTAKVIADYLQQLGLEVKTGVAHTGVVALLKGGKPGPVVALRADMDGLPVTERTNVSFASKERSTYLGKETGVMHACGHDSHMAILLGVATVLNTMKANLHGSIKFIFQPAEEGVPRGEEGGAELMVKEGVLDNPKVAAVFGLHINSKTEVGKITYRPGGFYASINDMKITVKGRSAHGAYPWQSVDPIVTAAQIINNLQTVISRNLDVAANGGIVTVGSVNGGNRSNIIPEQVEMLGTLRALNDADEKLIIDRVRTIATKTAESNGAEVEVLIPYSSHYPITFNDSALTARMLPSLQATAGAPNVILSVPHTGAEDFSFYQRKVPGLFINLGGMPKGLDPAKAAPHHTPDFYLDESGFRLGVEALANLAVDFMAGVPKTK